jgi:hypothetical protein
MEWIWFIELLFAVQDCFYALFSQFQFLRNKSFAKIISHGDKMMEVFFQ